MCEPNLRVGNVAPIAFFSGELLAREFYAKCIDERGYDTFWMAEHHLQPEGTELIPNVLMMAIGCGFNIVPTWHPLRLAEEDYAMAVESMEVVSEGAYDHMRTYQKHTTLSTMFSLPRISLPTSLQSARQGKSFPCRRT